MSTEPLSPSRPRWLRWGERLLATLVVVAAVWLAFHWWPAPRAPALSLAQVAVIGAVLLAAALTTLLLAGSRTSSLVRRVAVVVAALAFVAIAAHRWNAWRIVEGGWPMDPERSMSLRLDEASAAERANWAARVTAHLVAIHGFGDSVPVIPTDWPFPSQVRLAVERTPLALYVWSRTGEDSIGCLALPIGAGDLDSTATCLARRDMASALAFKAPLRGKAPHVAAVPAGGSPPWGQYRRDAARTGVGPSSADTATWRALTPGPVRASASAVGDLVLVGGHRTGALVAFDRATGQQRWRTWVPNWIHQDPISDGVTVLVGFGDNSGSFSGAAPSGVAAFDLATGAHRWTVLDESSVMTTGVLHGSLVTYATSAGVLRTRRIADGELVRSVRLPGAVVMAPPAVHHDTLVATLDTDDVCAVQLATLATIWCRRIPHLRAMGHTSPAIADGKVFLTGQASLLSLTVGDLRLLGSGMRSRLLKNLFKLPTHFPDQATGQAIVALRLEDGSVAWQSPVFLFRDWVQGHISGTATITPSLGVVSLPLADTVVAFVPETGEVRWAARGLRSRGPPLVVDGHVVIAGRDGRLDVRRLEDGLLVCTLRRTVGWDRAGPIRVADQVILADMQGRVESIPTAAILRCAPPPEVMVSHGPVAPA